jgi:hypothetical protein
MIRSWGQDRILLFVVDDFLIAIPLVVTASLMRNPTVRQWLLCYQCASGAVSAHGLRSARRPQQAHY